MSEQDDFLQELRESFLQEAQDLLGRVEELSLSLEKNPSSAEVYSELARLAHNFKGSGKAVGFDQISGLGHELESYILAIQKGTVPSSPENLDFLFACLDRLKLDVQKLLTNPRLQLEYTDLIEGLHNRIKHPEAVKAHAFRPAPASVNAEQDLMPTVSPAAAAQASFRVSKGKLDFLLEAFGEQVILQSTLEQCKEDVITHQELLRKTITQLSKITAELQNHALSLTLVSIRGIFTKLERAARDAGRVCSKEIDFSIGGAETEADKSLIDELSDPLTHMVRNAVDHGLESFEERLSLGKKPQGSVSVRAKRMGSQLWIEVQDDGKGLDPEKIKSKAIEKGILSKGDAMKLSESDAFQLIFANGFSTKEAVSEVSGRGVGMNVVQETVDRLKGQVEIESQLGKGTLFRLKLPLSLAIFNGAIVLVNETRYVIPNTEIEEISRISKNLASERVELSAHHQVIRIRGELFDLIDLRDRLGSGGKARTALPPKDIPVLLTRRGKNRAFLVDEIIGVQKVVQKPLGDEVKSSPGYVAGTILGDGTPGVILNLEALVSGMRHAA